MINDELYYIQMATDTDLNLLKQTKTNPDADAEVCM